MDLKRKVTIIKGIEKQASMLSKIILDNIYTVSDDDVMKIYLWILARRREMEEELNEKENN